ncbi:hypothetical protein [Actinophytocola sp. NPDC049390]|uniref:hypothetical protein n=1 Tax=Actinophytocola sp. NPDC049390 TaxID=3363894 RepID=UPI0037A1621A
MTMEIVIKINRETGEWSMTTPTEIESGEEFAEYGKITGAVKAYAEWLKAN